jgi:predicted PurR-regulated permease PerM
MANIRKITFYIVLVLLLIVAAVFVYFYSDKLLKILSPFLIAALIAYIIYPLVIRFERNGIKRSISIVVIYTFIILSLVFFCIYIMPQVIDNARELFHTLPNITTRYQDFFNNFVYKIKASKCPPELKSLIFNEINYGTGFVQGYAARMMKKSLSVLASSLAIALNVVLSMIIAYYFIKDAEGFKNSTLMLVPKKMRNELINTGRELNSIATHFIQGQLTTALIVGILETAGLYFVKVKYPFVLGLLGGIANIIPYFGPVLGAIPAVAVALLQSPYKAALAALVFIIVQQIDNAFISPKIIEGKLGLHPVTTIVAVLVGGEFFGIIGMLLGVPVTAMLKIILKRMVDSFV